MNHEEAIQYLMDHGVDKAVRRQWVMGDTFLCLHDKYDPSPVPLGDMYRHGIYLVPEETSDIEVWTVMEPVPHNTPFQGSLQQCCDEVFRLLTTPHQDAGESSPTPDA